MIHTRGIHKKLNSNSSYVTRTRISLKKGTITTDKMAELLGKAGWKKVVIEQWAEMDNAKESLSSKNLDRFIKESQRDAE